MEAKEEMKNNECLVGYFDKYSSTVPARVEGSSESVLYIKKAEEYRSSPTRYWLKKKKNYTT